MKTTKLNKTQIWNEVTSILEDVKFKSNAEKESAIARFEALLKPKSGGGASERPIYTIGGEEYKYCRFTDRYWPLEDLVYQNDELRAQKRDKGYSKIGMSLWSKGQKHLKALGDDITKAVMAGDMEKSQTIAQELKEIQDQNLANNAAWLVDNFATEEQRATIDSMPAEPVDDAELS